MLCCVYFSTNEAEFPAFTICPDYHEAYKEDILEKYNLTGDDVRNMKMPANLSMSIKDLLDSITYSLDELLNQLEFRLGHRIGNYSEIHFTNVKKKSLSTSR